MVRAMVLAAGLGTRLGSLSDQLPKPLLPVLGIPLIRWGLHLLAAHEFHEVAINLHHRGDLIVRELQQKPPSLDIQWSEEPTILGTGGALKQMGEWLTQGGREPFLVMNGKLIVDVDLPRLVTEHRASGAIATLVVREDPEAERWGAVDIDPQQRVVRLLGEGGTASNLRRTMFTGVHIVSPQLLELLPDGASCVIRNGYIPALRLGLPIGAHLYSGYFQEHSTPERYLQGNFALLRAGVHLRHAPVAFGGRATEARPGVIAPSYVGAGAQIKPGAEVGPFVVLNPGARVLENARIRHSVVWGGATASGSLQGAIVTPQTTVQTSLA